MSDTGIGDLVDRMTRTRDGNQRLIDALVAQNVALDAAITVLNGDAPPAAPTPAEPPVKKALPAAKVADKRTVTKHDYPKIARWIAEHKATGTYSLKTLAATFDVKEATANNFIGQCRKLGLLDGNRLVDTATTNGPTPPLTRAEPIGGRVLACDEPECDATFGINRASELLRHCVTAHGRQATNAERQPVAA